MKHITAIIAIAVVMFLWALFSVSVGWKRGGGVIPLLILMAIIGFIWNSITSPSKNISDSQDTNATPLSSGPEPPTVSPTSSSCSPDEKKYYAQAMEECTYPSKGRDPGLWAKTFSASNGDIALAQAKYIELRAAELIQRNNQHILLTSPVGLCPDCGTAHPVTDDKCPSCGRPKLTTI